MRILFTYISIPGTISSMKPIRRIKAKYYTKEVLKYLLAIGFLTISGAGPYFAVSFWQHVLGNKKVSKRKHSDVFRYLLRRNLIICEREGVDMRISLTPEGKKAAGKYQIDELSIPRPLKWDGKWRIVMFDIPNTSTFVRDVFRRKLKEFGFYRLQKSIWVFPFPCREEVVLLRDFLGATKKQIQVLEIQKIEDDRFLRKAFEFPL